MGNDDPAIGIKSAHFGQFEEFSAAFRDAGWSAEYVQLESGRFRGQMLSADLEPLRISHCVWEKELRHLGATPKGTIALGVTLSQQGRQGRYLGTEFDLDDILIIPDGTELQIVSAPNWRVAALVMPEEDFLDRMVSLIHADSPGDPGLATLTRPQGARLRRACEDFFRATERRARSGDQDFPLQSMAADLVDFAIGLIAEGRIEPLPKPGDQKRFEIFREAEEVVRSSEGDVPRIPELCRAIGTSERSLRYAFESTAGVSPLAYLKAQRLSRVHAALLEGAPGEILIKTAAYQHGFWHLGQFSQDYRQLFGETPSATLARARNASSLRKIA